MKDPGLELIATNAADFLISLRTKLICGGFSSDQAAELIKVFYTAWSGYLASCAAASVQADSGVMSALIGASKK